MCGRIINNALRKIHLEGKINWVEALPRMLRIQHDTVDETGISPYLAVFGRDRNLAGVPFQPPVVCPSAIDFVERMQQQDKEISRALNEFHRQHQLWINQKRPARPPFAEGDWVWLIRPKAITGAKMERWWTGPYRIASRSGESSYVLQLGPNRQQDAHLDQLKTCQWDIDLGESYPLVWRANNPVGSHSQVPTVKAISGHRYSTERGWEFHTTWDTSSEAEWVPVMKFLEGCDELWMRYILQNGIDLVLEAEPEETKDPEPPGLTEEDTDQV